MGALRSWAGAPLGEADRPFRAGGRRAITPGAANPSPSEAIVTLDQHARGLSVDRLGPPDLVELFGFLDHDPVLNVYLLALALRDGLSNPRDEFWAVRRDDTLVAVLHLGGQSGAALPAGSDPDALRALGDPLMERLELLPRRFQVIGPRAAVHVLAGRLRDVGRVPRIQRDQTYMRLAPGELAPFEPLPELRRATREDHAMLYESGARLRLEELEEDPRSADPAGYARRTDEECREGYTHVWVDARGLCFRASVSALTLDAAQVSGVYTPSERRNQGLARRGLSELCERLLARSRNVCLFVNDFNTPAIALYRRMGFHPIAEWASAFYQRPD
jgi:ribosomal protein S18 acetylase RimI-like enzyme